MESTHDIISADDSIKTESSSIADESIVSSKLTSIPAENVRNGVIPLSPQDDNSQHVIYNLMCPWDYLVNFSNVPSANDKAKSPTLCTVRIQSLVNNFELLINQFKVLLETSCSLDAKPPHGNEETSTCDNGKSIGLTESLSVALGYTKPMHLHLMVRDSKKIINEYDRCCNVLDSVIETIAYKDLPENSCGIDDDIPQLTNIKVEDDSICEGVTFEEELVDDGAGGAGSKLPQGSLVGKRGQKRKKKVSGANKLSPEIKAGTSMQKRIRPYEPLGYKPQFCISEQVYDELMNKSSPYTCPPCDKMFKDRRNFEHHLSGRCLGIPAKDREWEPKWKKEDGRLHCLHPGCSETYTHKQSLYKHHQRTHLTDAVDLPFKCDQCDKSFIIKSILSIHIQEMHKEKIRKCCEICGASVRSNTDLKLHMRRRHTGEMPFKCEYCDFRGVNISSVKRHTKLKHETHLLTFHYCDICGKQFKTKANLKEHIPTHSDKRTFLCKICGKCLKNDCSYRRHMVCVHGIKFTCELCGKDYSALIGLKVHQRNVHGINS